MPAIIAILVRALGWLVTTQIGQWCIKALFGLGIGLFATKVALPALKAQLAQYAGSLSSELLQCLGAVGGDVAMTMILSAYAASVAGNVVIKAMKQ